MLYEISYRFLPYIVLYVLRWVGFAAREVCMPDVITANRLADGVVVFQTADGGWSEDFNRAAVARTRPRPPPRSRAPRRTRRTTSSSTPMPSRSKSATAISSRRRCARRSAPPGPTVRRDLGKQAEGHAPALRPARPCWRPNMYRYDDFDAGLRRRARRAVPRPGRAPPLGRADGGAVPPAPADERALSAAPCLHAARSPCPTAR